MGGKRRGAPPEPGSWAEQMGQAAEANRERSPKRLRKAAQRVLDEAIVTTGEETAE
jgi:hypothetical protein